MSSKSTQWYKLITALALLWLLPAAVHGQLKDSALNEVKVHGTPKTSNDVRVTEFSPGQKVKAIDSATLQQYQLQNMAMLLSQQEPVFVKSYGFNGLATLNFRGSSSAQSEVMWNGIPIQNAALGIADVSTLPVLFMTKVNIVYGGSAALFGSGNVGGALLLESDQPAFGKGIQQLSITGGSGSYGQYLGGLNAAIANERWYLSVKLFDQAAQNNFSYTDNDGTKTKMVNDMLRSDAAMVQIAYKASTYSTISIQGWYQQYNREIPPALFETYSVKNEKDGSLRLLGEWEKRKENDLWYVKSSLVTDNTQYNDDEVLLHTNNTAYQYYQEAGLRKRLKQHAELLIFVPVQLSWINEPDSNTTRQQNRVALAAAYDQKFLNNKLNVAVNARGEAVNNQSILLPGADASYSITDWLQLRANAQRTYRVPTLNELYYTPGGNPGLKPEQGWNEDAGYTVKVKMGKFSLYHDLSLFNRNIHDWIIWLGGAIWTPHNIAEVHSRGTETQNMLTFKAGEWELHLGINTAYVLATTVSSYIYNDGSIGKQIPYTPRYNGQANIGFSYKKFTLNYNHTYTGYRFITTDESEYLPPYQTGNVQAMYQTHISQHNVQLNAQYNNIWDEQYQVVAGRLMPGPNWQAGFRVNLLR